MAVPFENQPRGLICNVKLLLSGWAHADRFNVPA